MPLTRLSLFLLILFLPICVQAQDIKSNRISKKKFYKETRSERVVKDMEFRDPEKYQNVELTLKPGYEDYLFVPFSDETSADESYGGGRFMDLRQPATNLIEIDFNKAYNPYCAYNHKYSCPIPPPENHLPIRIRAGEKFK